jgi:predicted flap endonuclease-1-like 5' DNA nuclease
MTAAAAFRTVTVAFALSFALLSARPAGASHYALTEVGRLIPPSDAEKLQKAGVETTEQLLQKGGTAKDRKALAKASGLSAGTVTTLVKHCDLLRIKGVGPEMVLLLEAAGVKSIADLAKRDAAGLAAATESANKSKKISEKLPTEPQLGDWIEQAKKLPGVVDAK